MLRSLRHFGSQEAQAFLANMTLAMMPHIENQYYRNIPKQELNLREKVNEEIRKKLRLNQGDNSREAIAKIYTFLSKNISKIALANSDINKIKNNVGQIGLLKNDLYKIELTDALKKDIQLFMIRPSHVENVIQYPDIYGHYYPGNFNDISDKSVSIFFKTPRSQSKDVFSMLILSERNGATLKIFNAWRLYHSDINILNCKSALDILETFANKYGMEFEFGNESYKFIFYKKLPYDKEDNKINIFKSNESSDKFQIQALMKINDNPPFIEVAIAFVLNIKKYLEDLKVHLPHK